MNEGNELAWMLSFFAKPVAAQWGQVPEEIERVWVHAGEVECPAIKPIKILALVFSSLLDGFGYIEFTDEDYDLEILDEIRTLLSYFILEGPWEEIYSSSAEPDQMHYVWLTLGRLCEIALENPRLKRIGTQGISFEYFIEKYSVPCLSS